MVEFVGKVEPAYMFEHYACVPDSSDRLCRNFGTKANRMMAELWDFFRCEPGFEHKANNAATRACTKLVKDMHYETHIQAIITYNTQVLGVRTTKAEARNMSLTRDQYL